MIHALFLSPSCLAGKNSWRQQPGTFLIVNFFSSTAVSGQRVQFCVAQGPWAAMLVTDRVWGPLFPVAVLSHSPVLSFSSK